MTSTNMINTSATPKKTGIHATAKPSEPTIYDAVRFVQSIEFHAALGDQALQYADQKVCYNVRPLEFNPLNMIWIITFWHQKVMGPGELIRVVRRQIDLQVDSKAETRRLQALVNQDHLLVKTGRVHGRPVLIVQLIED